MAPAPKSRKVAQLVPAAQLQRQLLGLKCFTGRVSDTLQTISPATHQHLIDAIVTGLNAEIDGYYRDHGEAVAPVPSPVAHDDANMLRRAYDALNILSALNFMVRGSDKRYYWVGPYFDSSVGIPTDTRADSLQFPEFAGEAAVEVVEQETQAPTPAQTAAYSDYSSEDAEIVSFTSAPTPTSTSAPAPAPAPAANPLAEEVASLRQALAQRTQMLSALHNLNSDNSVFGARSSYFLEPPFMVLAFDREANVDMHQGAHTTDEEDNKYEISLVIESKRPLKLFTDSVIIVNRYLAKQS